MIFEEEYEKRLKEYQAKKPLVFDGTGRYIEPCNLCGKTDIVFPTGTLHLCPNCLKKGRWDVLAIESKEAWKYGLNYPVKVPYLGIVKGYSNELPIRGRFVLVSKGICDVCGNYFVGAGASVEGWVCFKCLWYVLGRHRSRLSVGGTRIC